jgi:hypothetical protein
LRELLARADRNAEQWHELAMTQLRALPAPERRSWWSRFRAAG